VNVLWRPNPGPQTRFCETNVDECLYGGAAGGGKSAALVAMPLRWCDNPAFRALILRRETTQLVDLLDKADRLYDKAFPGARFNGTEHKWFFPSGASIWFTHCEHEKDHKRFHGLEFSWLGFDELTHFTLTQYREIRNRVRATAPGLPRHVRATTNPGGDGHDWVFERWGAWLNPECNWRGLKEQAKAGEVLRVTPDNSLIGEPELMTSRTFIPAKLEDNPVLLREDPTYRLKLTDNDPVRRAQLLDGNWLAKPARGLYFRRAWTPIVEAAPIKSTRVRYWDRAATVDGDWTAGVLMARGPDGVFYVENVVRLRGTPRDVIATIKTTAQLDGTGVLQVLEQDPGQAGVVELDMYTRELIGHRFKFVRPTGDKVTRFGPFSSQCEAGNVRLVAGPWNRLYCEELESFPEGDHDDQCDASSGAFGSIGLAMPALAATPGRPRRSLEGY